MEPFDSAPNLGLRDIAFWRSLTMRHGESPCRARRESGRGSEGVLESLRNLGGAQSDAGCPLSMNGMLPQQPLTPCHRTVLLTGRTVHRHKPDLLAPTRGLQH